MARLRSLNPEKIVKSLSQDLTDPNQAWAPDQGPDATQECRLGSRSGSNLVGR
jgi:hypothetical protein